MRVLIIGHSSMVGKRLCRELSAKHKIFTAGRGSDSNYEFHLDQDIKCFPEEQFDVIVHCAASFDSNDAVGMINNELVNSVGAFRVGQLAMHVNCSQLVFLSSLSIYDNPENGYFGSYGLSKRHAQENLSLQCGQAGIKFTAIEATQLYDEFGEARKHQPFFYHILDCARQGKELCVFGSVDPDRNFLFVDDLIKVIALVIDKQICGCFPCTHQNTYKLSEIAKIAFEAFGRLPEIRFATEKNDIPSVYIPTNHSLYRLIDYYPETSLSAGISMLSEFYRVM